MKVKVKTINEQDVEVPEHFKIGRFFYKVIDESHQLEVYDSGDYIALMIDLRDRSFNATPVEITEEEFMKVYYAAADKLTAFLTKEAAR